MKKKQINTFYKKSYTSTVIASFLAIFILSGFTSEVFADEVTPASTASSSSQTSTLPSNTSVSTTTPTSVTEPLKTSPTSASSTTSSTAVPSIGTTTSKTTDTSKTAGVSASPIATTTPTNVTQSTTTPLVTGTNPATENTTPKITGSTFTQISLPFQGSVSLASNDAVKKTKDLLANVSDENQNINESELLGASETSTSSKPITFTASTTPLVISSIDASLDALTTHHALSSKIQKEMIMRKPLQGIVTQEVATNYFAGLGSEESYTPSEEYSFKGFGPETTDAFVGAATILALIGGGLMMQYSRNKKYIRTTALINEIA